MDVLWDPLATKSCGTRISWPKSERSVKGLCDFLEVAYDPGMLEYTERARGNVLDRAARYNPNLTSKPMSQVRSWEDDMPRIQVEVFEAVAGDLLAGLEYPRAFPHPSLRAKAMAALGAAGLPIGRLKSTCASRARWRGSGGVGRLDGRSPSGLPQAGTKCRPVSKARLRRAAASGHKNGG